MFKNKMNVVIYLSLLIPFTLSAAPLDKYYIPQQSSGYTAPVSEPEDVYAGFRKKSSSLSPQERDMLKRSFQTKRDTASQNKNFDAAAHYQKLINILKSF